MNAVDIFIWIVIGGAVGFILVMGYYSLIMVSKYDQISDEQWEESCGKDESDE